MQRNEASDLVELARLVGDGASVALAPDYSGCPLALVREVIRAKKRELYLIGCPQLGLQADLLIGAGCVASIETAAIGLGELGLAPAFDRVYREGRIEVKESTCPAIHAGLQAAEKGVPFLPVSGVLGSDLIAARPDWHIGEDPFGGGPILLVPAIRPDLALFHAPMADRLGNVWIGVRRELMLMAHAALRTFVTVEAVREESLLDDERLAAGTIPALYVDRIAIAANGAHPCGLFGRYGPDRAWLRSYAETARSEQGFGLAIAEWLSQ